MPVSKKKRITSTSDPSTSEPSSPVLPDQQAFHQYLRTLAQSAVRIVIETVMREELEQFIGVGWGECSPKRKGYRNGHYRRDLVTSTGRLEEMKVPRDREGQFHTQVFDRYSRDVPHIAEGLTQMFVAGTSTHKVGEVAQTFMGVAPSASTISRLNQTLTQQYEAWRERVLQAHYHIVYLDGVHFSIRHGDKADSTIILTALGVDLNGNKDVLALRACAEESKEGWISLLQDLRTRGATQIDLIVTDGHDGLLASTKELFSATPRQRCLVHKQRNVLNTIPRRERGDVQAELVGIWDQPTHPQALLQLAAFKALYWLLGTSVQKEILWLVIVSLFLSARGNSGIEIVGESFSTTRENKEVLAADSHERHAQTAGESCKRQLQACCYELDGPRLPAILSDM